MGTGSTPVAEKTPLPPGPINSQTPVGTIANTNGSVKMLVPACKPSPEEASALSHNGHRNGHSSELNHQLPTEASLTKKTTNGHANGAIVDGKTTTNGDTAAAPLPRLPIHTSGRYLVFDESANSVQEVQLASSPAAVEFMKQLNGKLLLVQPPNHNGTVAINGSAAINGSTNGTATNGTSHQITVAEEEDDDVAIIEEDQNNNPLRDENVSPSSEAINGSKSVAEATESQEIEETSIQMDVENEIELADDADNDEEEIMIVEKEEEAFPLEASELITSDEDDVLPIEENSVSLEDGEESEAQLENALAFLLDESLANEENIKEDSQVSLNFEPLDGEEKEIPEQNQCVEVEEEFAEIEMGDELLSEDEDGDKGEEESECSIENVRTFLLEDELADEESADSDYQLPGGLSTDVSTDDEVNSADEIEIDADEAEELLAEIKSHDMLIKECFTFLAKNQADESSIDDSLDDDADKTDNAIEFLIDAELAENESDQEDVDYSQPVECQELSDSSIDETIPRKEALLLREEGERELVRLSPLPLDEEARGTKRFFLEADLEDEEADSESDYELDNDEEETSEDDEEYSDDETEIDEEELINLKVDQLDLLDNLEADEDDDDEEVFDEEVDGDYDGDSEGDEESDERIGEEIDDEEIKEEIISGEEEEALEGDEEPEDNHGESQLAFDEMDDYDEEDYSDNDQEDKEEPESREYESEDSTNWDASLDPSKMTNEDWRAFFKREDTELLGEIGEKYELQYMWEGNAPFLYDLISAYQFMWPSQSVEWIPDAPERPADSAYTIHQLAVGTDTNELHANYIMLKRYFIPNYDLAKVDNFLTVRVPNAFGAITSKFEDAKQIPHQGDIYRLRVMPQDTKLIATKSSNGKVYLFDSSKYGPASSGEATPELTMRGHSEPGFGLSWSHVHAGHLASCAADGLICLYDVNQPLDAGRKRINPYLKLEQAHDGKNVCDVQWSFYDPDTFASGGTDATVRLWDRRSVGGSGGPRASHVITGHTGDINCVSFHPFGEDFFLTASADLTIGLWDLRNLSVKLHTFENGHSGEIFQVSWNPNHQTIFASSGADEKVCIWNLTDIGRPQDVEDDEEGPPELAFVHSGHRDKINDISWCPTEPWLMASVDQENLLHAWKIGRHMSEELEVSNEGGNE